MKRPRLTLVGIEGRDTDLSALQFALAHSSEQLGGVPALLLSPVAPALELPGIRHVPIGRLNYFEYSAFMLYALRHLVDSDHSLVIQHDGWVLDGSRWDDRFLDYDYVGAPTHLGRVRDSLGTSYYRGFQWTQFLGREGVQLDIVQNGGFSLRSRALLEGPAALGLQFVISPRSCARTPASPSCSGAMRPTWRTCSCA